MGVTYWQSIERLDWTGWTTWLRVGTQWVNRLGKAFIEEAIFAWLDLVVWWMAMGVGQNLTGPPIYIYDWYWYDLYEWMSNLCRVRYQSIHPSLNQPSGKYRIITWLLPVSTIRSYKKVKKRIRFSSDFSLYDNQVFLIINAQSGLCSFVSISQIPTTVTRLPVFGSRGDTGPLDLPFSQLHSTFFSIRIFGIYFYLPFSRLLAANPLERAISIDNGLPL